MSADPEQVPLFEKGEWWDEHWKGMPEYVSNNLKPYRTILVHFESLEDVLKFQEVIKQKILPSQCWIWFPESNARADGVGMFANKSWIDAPQEPDDDEVLSEG